MTSKKLSARVSLWEIIEAQGSGPEGSRTFLEDARSERRITFKQLRRAVDGWQAVLLRRDIPTSASIIVDVSDPLTFALTHVSLVALGYRSIPINPESQWSEVERIIGMLDDIRIVVSDREAVGSAHGRAVLNPHVTDSGEPPQSKKPVARGSVLLYTSGSTGTPKGVELDERQLLYVASQVAHHNCLSASDRGFNSLPLFHINAQVVGLFASLLAGATLVLDRRFHKSGFWELMRERKITWINAVPAIMAILARETLLDFPPGLRFIRSASATLPDVLKQSFANTTLIVSWGMTEGASQITATPLDQPLRPGSVGLPVGAEVQARDDSGHALPAGSSGMLWIRGKGIITHYLDNRAADRFDADGWLETGDIGRLDGDGYVYLLGRSDDVINRGGEKLYPIEIENVILQEPTVREAIVTSREDDVLGQIPVAYVISTIPTIDEKGARMLQATLHQLCDEKLPAFKRPPDIIIMRDVPRASTGKVKRAELREMASDNTLFSHFPALAT